MAHRTDLDLDLEERRRVLDAWALKRRQIAVLEAEAAELLIEQFDIHDQDVAESPYHRDAIYRSMIAEFSAAARIPRSSMEFAFADARSLRDSMPGVRAAFADGRITAAHVREIVRAGAVVAEAIANRRADAAVMDLFETAALVVAECDTAARTRAHAREVAASLAGETVVERHRRAAKDRSVSVTSLDDGLALLTAVLPEWIALAIQDRLTHVAREVIEARGTREPQLDPSIMGPGADSLHAEDVDLADPFFDAFLADPFAPAILADTSADTTADAASAERDSTPGTDSGADADFGADADSDAGMIFSDDRATFARDPLSDVERIPADERSLDEIRADVLTDMLLTATPSTAFGDALDDVHARIQVTVAATTLAGLDDRPAQLDGHGALDADIARALAGRNSGWTRLFLDPSGLVVETDTYTPTTAMKRFLRARDQHCRFPGCRMPVHRSEIDHNHDHAKGGRTAVDNLAHFCRTHHALKHPDVPDPHRWTAQQRPGGSITWTSPLGRAYTDRTPRRVMFV
ncbi:DUF222 domain-containing protein [Microbacterium sp. LWH10-1.2]|uniref:HNH endonuclease signature motif containing protein n=1 Tax=Microbacterium sp. LWH10-1.2 TaxID=3135255 RepID=UPI0031387615